MSGFTNLAWAVGLGLTFGGGLIGYDMYRKSADYVQVAGEVRAAHDLCRLKIDKRRNFDETGLMTCAKAQMMQQSHPEYWRYEVKHQRLLEIAFTSPADHAPHIAQLEQTTQPSGAMIKVGDTLDVLAHKQEPLHLRRISEPLR